MREIILITEVQIRETVNAAGLRKHLCEMLVPGPSLEHTLPLSAFAHLSSLLSTLPPLQSLLCLSLSRFRVKPTPSNFVFSFSYLCQIDHEITAGRSPGLP